MSQFPLNNCLLRLGMSVILASFGASFAHAQVNIGVCHATGSSNGTFIYLVIPAPARRAHTGQGHERDFISTTGDCGRIPTMTPAITPTPRSGGTTPDNAPTPEPVTMLLFGAGLVGVGYVSRRFLGKRKDEDERGE
ncbi:MAG: PEP-CTERM sorting domain-containing protein [Saprospiraceae bacterium]|nr:PEP-CTERM sorting domain-containing protein [Pyrinomonadaceae bacterium]